jgi:hypothetical protein
VRSSREPPRCSPSGSAPARARTLRTPAPGHRPSRRRPSAPPRMPAARLKNRWSPGSGTPAPTAPSRASESALARPRATPPSAGCRHGSDRAPSSTTTDRPRSATPSPHREGIPCRSRGRPRRSPTQHPTRRTSLPAGSFPTTEAPRQRSAPHTMRHADVRARRPLPPAPIAADRRAAASPAADSAPGGADGPSPASTLRPGPRSDRRSAHAPTLHPSTPPRPPPNRSCPQTRSTAATESAPPRRAAHSSSPPSHATSGCATARFQAPPRAAGGDHRDARADRRRPATPAAPPPARSPAASHPNAGRSRSRPHSSHPSA